MALFGDLDEDVCRYILHELAMRDLLSLSMTCRWLRAACMPSIFGRSYISAYGPSGITRSRVIPPPSLRSYVHSLRIQDNCLFELKEKPKLCDVYPGAPLAERLRKFPHLRSLTIHTRKVTHKWHGMAWDTLRAVLSMPHLRDFKLINLHFCPVLRPGEDFDIDSLAPITSFQHRLCHPREPWSFSTETAALAAVLTKLCERLETLILMSEPAPMCAIAQLRWPRLRKLIFYGSPWTNLPAPFISLCSGMQSLRCLSLKLNPTPDAKPQPIWPPDFACSFPWPELERLVISYPDPRDEVYDHLPPSLHALSLRCWHHIYIQQFLHHVGRAYYPDRGMLLGASAMLSILYRCETLALQELEVEYRADEEENVLLQYIATTFARLKSLKIHRYRSAFDCRDTDPAVIAYALAPLAELRHFKVSLDFLPIKRPKDIIQIAAAVFARVLKPSLRLVMIHDDDEIWRAFDVVEECAHEREVAYAD